MLCPGQSRYPVTDELVGQQREEEGDISAVWWSSIHRSPSHLIVRDMPLCFARAVYIWGGLARAGKAEGGLAWSRKPMPVLTLMTCSAADAESSARATSICVSAVLRETVARLDIGPVKSVTRPIMLVSRLRVLRRLPPPRTRTFFSFFRKQPPQSTLAQDALFHPFSKSPLPAIRARAEAVKSLAPCPICQASSHDIQAHVRFECPDCGWPTHCSEEHWKDDAEHQKYCRRLREANEDEHDLRSGRRMREFELPGACAPCVEK